MAKARMIRPEIWTDEKFVSLDPLARLLFIGMWNHACDNGHLDDSPIQLKMRVLPMDACDVPALLEQVISTGMVTRHDGYIKIKNLATRQKIDARYALLCDHCAHDVHTVWSEADKVDRTSSAQRAHAERTRAHDVDTTGARAKRREEKVREGKGDKPRSRAHPRPSDWHPSDTHQAKADEHGLNLQAEVESFKAWTDAKGQTYKDWDAAFTNHLLREAKNARPAPAFVQRLDAERVKADRAWGVA